MTLFITVVVGLRAYYRFTDQLFKGDFCYIKTLTVISLFTK